MDFLKACFLFGVLFFDVFGAFGFDGIFKGFQRVFYGLESWFLKNGLDSWCLGDFNQPAGLLWE